MFKKIIASAALAGALTLAVAAPAVVSAAPAVDSGSTISAIGNWPDPMRIAAPTKSTTTTPPTYTTSSIGNWPDPM